MNNEIRLSLKFLNDQKEYGEDPKIEFLWALYIQKNHSIMGLEYSWDEFVLTPAHSYLLFVRNLVTSSALFIGNCFIFISFHSNIGLTTMNLRLKFNKSSLVYIEKISKAFTRKMETSRTEAAVVLA